MTAENGQKVNKRRVVASLLGLPVYFAVFMFLPAGDWTWPKGWLFIGVFLGVLARIREPGKRP